MFYRHTDDSIFDDFPKISDHIPKISKDLPKHVKRSHKGCQTFSKNFRRLPKIAKDSRGRPEDILIIHQYI